MTDLIKLNFKVGENEFISITKSDWYEDLIIEYSGSETTKKLPLEFNCLFKANLIQFHYMGIGETIHEIYKTKWNEKNIEELFKKKKELYFKIQQLIWDFKLLKISNFYEFSYGLKIVDYGYVIDFLKITEIIFPNEIKIETYRQLFEPKNGSKRISTFDYMVNCKIDDSIKTNLRISRKKYNGKIYYKKQGSAKN